MKAHSRLILPFLLAIAFLPGAQAADDHASDHSAGTAQSRSTTADSKSISEGEIRKVDKAAGKLTIKHGPLKNLDMPSMTMVFRVKDLAMLDQVKIGDRISFVADKVGGQFTVVELDVKS